MSEIKIFVSHRIDIDSELIDNPIYANVRCGAVFDDKNPMKILGDNTGDNISERRMSFCEFTVQYWAWKNVEADYYGLCHYRRYLSFAEKHFKTDEYNMVHVPVLTPKSKKRYGLTDNEKMLEVIPQFDIITSEYAEAFNIPTPKGKKAIIREMWDDYDGEFFEKASIDLMFELIDKLAPEYSLSAREYFAGTRHRGFNCYILKKELFLRMCEFQFPIMFEVEHRLDTTGYTQTMKRTPAFIGEMLYGIFLYHVTTYESWRVKELQLVYFNDTDRIKSHYDLFKRQTWYVTDRLLRKLVDPIMPKGTKSRESAKRIIFSIFPSKKRGMANIK